MSEFKLTLRDVEKETFKLAFAILSKEKKPIGNPFRCVSYQVIDNEFYLFSSMPTYHKVFEHKELPYPFDLDQTIELAWGWWENNKKPKESEPDTDGSTEVAFEITTELPEPYRDSFEVICKIRPIWFVYGK